MKSIKVVSMKLTNFKGIVQADVRFNGVTHVKGDNATGKSTLFNAFLWLLFGKDAEDRKDFEIKTIGMSRAEHEVQAEMNINGQTVTLRRVYKEKWQKKRGNDSDEFTGHETLFFVNDVPFSASDYQKYVGEIVSEEHFKLITNPQYFNGLSKDKKREMLIRLAGKIEENEIVGDDNEFKGLIHLMLTTQKTAEMLKKEYAVKKKRIQDLLNSFPARQEEVQRMLPELVIVPENALQRVEELSSMLMLDVEAAKKLEAEQGEKMDKLRKLYEDMREIEMKIIRENDRMKNDFFTSESKAFLEVAELENKIAGDQLALNQLINQQSTVETDLQELRTRYANIAKSLFVVDPTMMKCPTCQQDIPDAESRVTDMRNRFNAAKATSLNEINEKGLKLKEEQATISNSIAELQSNIAAVSKRLAEMKAANENKPITYLSPEALKMAVDSALFELRQQVDEINKETEQETDAARIEKIKEIEKERDMLIDILAKQSENAKTIENLEKRLDELKKQQKSTASELASVEREEMVIERFKRRHDEILEERINKMFDIVKFRLFKPQINGGIEEVCDALINGVPYQAANNAAQINAGIDICNVFAKRIGVSAPVWVDNAEAVNEIHKSSGQMVLLSVTKDKALTIQ